MGASEMTLKGSCGRGLCWEGTRERGTTNDEPASRGPFDVHVASREPSRATHLVCTNFHALPLAGSPRVRTAAACADEPAPDADDEAAGAAEGAESEEGIPAMRRGREAICRYLVARKRRLW